MRAGAVRFIITQSHLWAAVAARCRDAAVSSAKQQQQLRRQRTALISRRRLLSVRSDWPASAERRRRRPSRLMNAVSRRRSLFRSPRDDVAAGRMNSSSNLRTWPPECSLLSVLFDAEPRARWPNCLSVLHPLLLRNWSAPAAGYYFPYSHLPSHLTVGRPCSYALWIACSFQQCRTIWDTIQPH